MHCDNAGSNNDMYQMSQTQRELSLTLQSLLAGVFLHLSARFSLWPFPAAAAATGICFQRKCSDKPTQQTT